MKIRIDQGTLDVPSGISMDIDEMSPIFNELGSQSLPVTIPVTKRNATLMDFAHRIDAASDRLRRLPVCYVEDGLYSRRGALNLTEASTADGYSFSIGFDNSEAYAAWQQRKLPDLSGLPVIYYNSVSDLLDRMEALYRSSDPQTDDLAVFPICIKAEENDDTPICDLLNEPDSGARLGRETEVRRIVDGSKKLVTVPLGYGVTPFIRAWRLLELVFADLGLVIENNPLRSDRDMARIVVLNNVADCCCTGTLDYAALMPTVTVQDFLKSLWVRFGLTYTVDFTAGTARVRLLRDILAADAQCDITHMTALPPVVTYEQPQYVRLSAQKSLDMAEPGADTWQDFMKGRNPSSIYHLTDESDLSGTALTSLVHDCETHEWAWSVDGAKVSTASSFFDWDPQPPRHDAYELDSPDECVALRRMIINYEGSTVPMYLTGAVHRHTALRISDGTTSDKDDAEETPLSYMLAIGRNTMNDYTTGRLSGHGRLGEPIEMHDPGDQLGEMTLLMQFAGGHFDLFWRSWDEVCRHSSRTIETVMRIPISWLMEYDILAPVIYCGVRCLIDSISYTLPAGPMVSATVRLHPIQTQGTYDISKEQQLPALDATAMTKVWAFDHDTLDDVADDWLTKRNALMAFCAESPDERADYQSAELTLYRTVRTGKTPAEQDLSDFDMLSVSTAARTFTAIASYHITCGDLPEEWFDFPITYVATFRAHYE